MRYMGGWSNSFLMLAGLLLAGLAGCGTPKMNKEDAYLSVFVETKTRNPELARRIEWLRSSPQEAYLDANPVFNPLTHLDKAEVVNDSQGFMRIRLTFNERGKRLLNTVATTNAGRRLFLMAWYREQPEQKDMKPRCIGVRIFDRPDRNGEFIFLPDTSAEEAKRLVTGFNNTAKKLQR
ncbi:MAG: hypothetical protein CMO66_04550 [Verrucomicrobiales bacterium]|nr:hypothetical protein [Verrucomicrobiales bacterium]